MKKAKRNQITLNVLKSFDGFTGEIIETVTRTGRRCGGYTVRGPRTWKGHWVEVSYKGKMYKVNHLGSCYGDLAGSFITIGR